METHTHAATGSAVLGEAASVARYAPSVHNTQPWKWAVGPTGLTLRFDRTRRLPAADPSGRLSILSCGASLYYARLAVAANGHQAEVARSSPFGDRDLLAHVTVGEPIDDVRRHQDRLRKALVRRTDRRTPAGGSVAAWQLERLRAAVEAEAAHLHLVRQEDFLPLSLAAQSARDLDRNDPSRDAERTQWVGGRRDAAGVPGSAIPRHGSRYLLPPRFDGTADVGGSYDPDEGDDLASFVILFADTDDPAAWLRGGEALASAWITATGLGLSVVPFSDVIEIDIARERLRGLLSGVGYPLLVLRVGRPDPKTSPTPLTPRLAS